MRPRSHAFLLRCWREFDKSPGKGAVWRFSLIHINQNHQKKGFVDLAEVMDYLRQQMESAEEDQQFNVHVDKNPKEN